MFLKMISYWELSSLSFNLLFASVGAFIIPSFAVTNKAYAESDCPSLQAGVLISMNMSVIIINL